MHLRVVTFIQALPSASEQTRGGVGHCYCFNGGLQVHTSPFFFKYCMWGGVNECSTHGLHTSEEIRIHTLVVSQISPFAIWETTRVWYTLLLSPAAFPQRLKFSGFSNTSIKPWSQPASQPGTRGKGPGQRPSQGPGGKDQTSVPARDQGERTRPGTQLRKGSKLSTRVKGRSQGPWGRQLRTNSYFQWRPRKSGLTACSGAERQICTMSARGYELPVTSPTL